uniref:non-specific serine/threonine protein kinase n=1 Tax=Araucaria cunninghamii TaxID=56994 RepID=A0A0D6QT48_ARACU
MNIQGIVKCIQRNPKRSSFLLMLSINIIVATLLQGSSLVLLAILLSVSLLLLFSLWWYRAKYKGGDKNCGDKIFIDGEVLRRLSGHPDAFSYKEIDTATNSFGTEIGRGGFGSVFLGTLKDGRKVAVKQLNNTEEEGRDDFIAEVRTLASINHSNLVRLYGFCVEERHLLVYEFMDNGSLHDWLFNSIREPLDWKTRYSIAVETARGLAYLHEYSTSCILHLDVKPHNILLDENFRAKLSDFGLAKILNKDESRLVTFHVRGTPGYIAPEWVLEYGITAKTDVYSYGMVLLEIVCGRRVVDRSQDTEQWYLPSVAFEKARQGNLEELFDSRLSVSEAAAVEMKRLINLALWCIQSNSALRPRMSVILQILEGGLQMMDPPLDCSLPFGPSDDNNHLLSIVEEDTQALLGKSSSSMDHEKPPISSSHVVVVNVA